MTPGLLTAGPLTPGLLTPGLLTPGLLTPDRPRARMWTWSWLATAIPMCSYSAPT
jgi:hypothetical protein